MGTLYRVDARSGLATEIEIGGKPLTSGDGILLDGKSLYVVQNQFNQIAEIRLSPDGNSGTLVDVITSEAFDVPTTVAAFGNSLYAVNARFGISNPGSATYDVVRVRK